MLFFFHALVCCCPTIFFWCLPVLCNITLVLFVHCVIFFTMKLDERKKWKAWLWLSDLGLTFRPVDFSKVLFFLRYVVCLGLSMRLDSMRACLCTSLLQMPVCISYVQSAIYTKPSGYFFKACCLSFCPFISSLRRQTPSLPEHHVSLGTTVTGSHTSHSLRSFLLLGVFQRFPVDLIIETFQQIAGENITPKVVASRGRITMLLISVQIS